MCVREYAELDSAAGYEKSPTRLRLQQSPDHRGVEFVRDVRVGEQARGEFGFVLLELVDALFDGVLSEEFVDEDGFVLADAVGPVGGLGLGGGVPPGVVVDDGVGGGEVEAGAAGFEQNEERENILLHGKLETIASDR